MIPDNYSQFLAHEARQERHRAKLPVCCECGEPIQSDYLFDMDGELICEDCMKNNHQSCTENYIFE